MKSNEFLSNIEGIAESFRQKIELEVEAFPVSEKAKKKRIDAVFDSIDGYRFFCEKYFPHYFTKKPSLLHLDLYRGLPKILTNKTGERRLMIAPRGSAKSTHISQAFPLWCIVTGQKHFICLIMDAFEQAAIMVEAIKAELEFNPRLAYDFHNIVGQGRVWREGVIVTNNNIKIEGFGTGKKIRGHRHGPHRPDLVILDDVENDESPRQRDKLEKWISKAIIDADNHINYAEPFVGMGGIFLRRTKRPKAEFINNYNGDVYNLFRILQVHYVAFLDVLRFQIITQAEFIRLIKVDSTTLTDLQRAARFLYLQRTAFGGRIARQSFGLSTDRPGRFNLTTLEPDLEALHKRLSGVTIVCENYDKFITRIDRKSTLFYLDPPYFNHENDYGKSMLERANFERLAQQLSGIKGRFLMSINDVPKIRDLFQAFNIAEVQTSYSLSKKKEDRGSRTELLISNFGWG